MSVRRVHSLIAHLPATSRTLEAEYADASMWPLTPSMMPLFHAMWLAAKVWAGDSMPAPEVLFARERPRPRPQSMADWIAVFAPFGAVPLPP